MPQQISSRDDLKKDPFQDKLQVALEWIAAHRQTFFSIVGTVAVVIVVAVFVATNFRSLNRQAWERYNRAQGWAEANNPSNALSSYDDVITNFGRTKAATFALLGKGDILYRQRRLPEAIQAYQQCLAKGPSKLIAPFALSGLGAAQEDNADFAGAIETYKQFTANYPDHILAPKIYESLARAYEYSRNPDAAKEVYEKIMTMFPDSLWAQNARGRYQTLAPAPFQDTKPK